MTLVFLLITQIETDALPENGTAVGILLRPCVNSKLASPGDNVKFDAAEAIFCLMGVVTPPGTKSGVFTFTTGVIAVVPLFPLKFPTRSTVLNR